MDNKIFGIILLRTNDNFIHRKSILVAMNVEKTLKTPIVNPTYNQLMFSFTKKIIIQANTSVKTVE
jgi:hypothetical protein